MQIGMACSFRRQVGIHSLTDGIYGSHSGHVVSGNDFCSQMQYAMQEFTPGAPVNAASNYWGTASATQAGLEAGDSRSIVGGGTISQLPILLSPATSANLYPGDGNALAASRASPSRLCAPASCRSTRRGRRWRARTSAVACSSRPAPG